MPERGQGLLRLQTQTCDCRSRGGGGTGSLGRVNCHLEGYRQLTENEINFKVGRRRWWWEQAGEGSLTCCHFRQSPLYSPACLVNEKRPWRQISLRRRRVTAFNTYWAPTLNKAWWPGPGEGAALGRHREPQASSRAWCSTGLQSFHSGRLPPCLSTGRSSLCKTAHF